MTIKKIDMWADNDFVDVTFEENGQDVTVTRKVVKKKKEIAPYCLINGKKVYFGIVNGDMSVLQIKDAYDVKSDRKTRATTEGISKAGPVIKLDDIKPLQYKVDIDKAQMEMVARKTPHVDTVFHKEHDTIKTCIENDIPVYLAGPAGSGKNFTLEAIASQLGLDFYFTNSVQQEYKLSGFIDAGGRYHETEFYKAFRHGGLFFLDEMDSSIPEVLVLLNAAIANKYFEFPSGRITAHKDFRVVAAGNTVGSGADDMYTGRMVLDQATLDRFAIIDFGYDRKVELSIAGGDHDIVELVRTLRERAEAMGVRATFSYRCIQMIAKLMAVWMPFDKIVDIAIFKGLDKDTRNTLCITNISCYDHLVQRQNKEGKAG